MKSYRLVAAVAAICLSGYAAHAGTINFESGFADLDPVSAVVLPGENTVTFSVGSKGAGPAYIAAVGGPETAFAPDDMTVGGRAGGYFLTDETAGPSVALDYFMEFAAPIELLSLHVYDFRGDGGAPVGSTVTLTLYDAFDAVVGTDSFTIPALLEEGNVIDLTVVPGANAMWAALTFDAGDIGIGVDNITIRTVPEPSAAACLLGAVALGCFARRRLRK